ncbi:MAG: hypothetical protein WAO07_12630 [Desulfobacterales bacterium]
MRNRFFIIIITMAVIFSMASAGVCATLVIKTAKNACETKHHSKGGFAKTAAGKCHVTHCQAQNGKVYLLPDTFSRRPQDEMRNIFSMPGLAGGTQPIAGSGHLRGGRHVLKFPSTFYPPPLLSLHCACIC